MILDKKKTYRAIEVKDANDPEAVAGEILAGAIVDVSEAAKRLLNGRLSKRAIYLLIQDAAPGHVPLSSIEATLEAAANLQAKYIRKSS